MDLSIYSVFNLILSCCLWDAEARNYNSIITVSNGGLWGVWGDIDFCPQGYAHGFSLKVEPHLVNQDDTALNGIRLYCTDGSVIESIVAPWGTWTSIQYCPKGNLISYSLRVEEHQRSGDDTAANNFQNQRLKMVLWVRAVQSLILIHCLWMSEARQHSSVITVPNGGAWGTWGDVVLCPQGYAYGFSIKVQEYQGAFLWQDDTSLNSIRLYCTNGSAIESKAGPKGTWSDVVKCPKGYLVAFSLQVVGDQGIGDDVAANNIQFTCEDGATVVTKSHDWGTFGQWSQRCPEGYICGLQTKVEDIAGRIDETALNDVKMFCCK